MNRLVMSSIVTATLLLVGCGGGGSSSSTTTNLADNANGDTTPTTAKKIGTGYYVDSAIEGIDYKCGSQSGVTAEDGSFNFESNQSCDFTLGGVKIRTVDKSLLEDNLTILENNETVAQLLQTLDADGNASNGIQILKGTNETIKDTITSLSDLDEDTLDAIHDRMKSELSDYNGTVVDMNQTKAHLEETLADLESHNIKTQLHVSSSEENGSTITSGTGTMTHNGNGSDTISENNETHNGMGDMVSENNETHNGMGDMVSENNETQNTTRTEINDMVSGGTSGTQEGHNSSSASGSNGSGEGSSTTERHITSPARG